MTAPAMELRRPPETAPAEPGWYYAIPRDFVTGADPTISPVRLRRIGGLMVVDVGGKFGPPQSFRWFGRVPTCVEAARPDAESAS